MTVRRPDHIHEEICRKQQVETRRLESAWEGQQTAGCRAPEATGLGGISRTEASGRYCASDFRLNTTEK